MQKSQTHTVTDLILDSISKTKQKKFEIKFDDGIESYLIFRKDFFQKIDRKYIKKANLIENVDMFSDNVYSAFLQVDDDIFTYHAYLSKDIISFGKTNMETFMKDKISYRAESCILSKMMNNDLSDLLDDHITSNFHYSIYITRIKSNNTVGTLILNDICW